MTRRVATIVLFASSLTGAARGQEAWTPQELAAHAQGFLREEVMDRLQQIGRLLAQRDRAVPAILARIHGDHREYLLQIQRLLDQLTDERWLSREQAERRLVEVGARARAMLEDRAQHGRLLEERIRCRRILDEINRRGTEKEEREIAILRGLVTTAVYLPASDALREALVSALGHTDPAVVSGAIFALGIHGGDAEADTIARIAGQQESPRRSAALAALARMGGARALATCRELLTGEKLATHEWIDVLREVRKKPEAAELVRRLAGSKDAVRAAAARLRLPPAGGHPVAVRPELEGFDHALELRGITADAVVLASPIDGLDRVEIRFAECPAFELPGATASPTEGERCRVFLTQGSLVSGRLERLDGEAVRLRDTAFGGVRIPRGMVQGVALVPALDRLIGASYRADRVRLRDGSLVEGEILDADANRLRVRDAKGREVEIALAKVAGLLLRRPLEAPQDNSVYTRLDLARGDRLLGFLAAANAEHVGFVLPGVAAATIPLRTVKRIETGVQGGAIWGFTLIADYSDNKIVEVDERGREVLVLEEILGAWDAECLDNGNLLITEFSVSRVQEMTRGGETVWSYEDLRNPYDADRLPNGNTLIADTFKGRVIEVDPQGHLVWKYDQKIRPFDADRLPNGNTLIADMLGERVIEVDPQGHLVWQFQDAPNVHDADRLPNGNTLITLRTLNKVIEVDVKGRVVFEIDDLNSPSDADRLPNGNTLVAENGMVREFDRNKKVVWRKEMTWAVEVNRY